LEFVAGKAARFEPLPEDFDHAVVRHLRVPHRPNCAGPQPPGGAKAILTEAIVAPKLKNRSEAAEIAVTAMSDSDQSETLSTLRIYCQQRGFVEEAQTLLRYEKLKAQPGKEWSEFLEARRPKYQSASQWLGTRSWGRS
jgi:hypothetical protein